MEQRKKRTQRDYTLAFKIAIVAEVERGDFTYKMAQKQYGIQGRSTILVWLRKLGTLDWTNPKQRLVPTIKAKTPQQFIKELEAALEKEKQKTLLLNTMIDIAEKQHGLSIRKKHSPKQQSNSSKQED